jgi:hypothetical protein
MANTIRYSLPDCGDLSTGYFKGASSRAMERNSGWSADIRRFPTVYVAISGFRSRLTGGSRSDDIACMSSATSASSSAPSPQNFGMQVLYELLKCLLHRKTCRSFVQGCQSCFSNFFQLEKRQDEAPGVSIGFGGNSENSVRYDGIVAKRDRVFSKRREPDGQKNVDRKGRDHEAGQQKRKSWSTCTSSLLVIRLTSRCGSC